MTKTGTTTTRHALLALVVAFSCALMAMALSAMVYGKLGSGMPQLSLASPARLWAWMVGDDLEANIFWRLRMPRILGAALVGAGLAGAGCAFQATLRNPLAEPYTLGVSSGAALFAVLAIRMGLDTSIAGASGVGVAALVGALLTVYLVWRIASMGDHLPPATLLLAGITVAMFCGAMTMVVQYTAEVGEVYRMVRWMMGGLDGVLWRPLQFAGPSVLLGLAMLLYLARDFNALAAGSDAATSLGTNARRTVTLAFAASALLVGAGIAVAGPIGFIGLIVPHIMRALVGADHRVLIPVSALAGAASLVLCDLLARALLYPAELPVGVLTALLGGPFFLALLLREKRRGGLWGG